MSAQPLTAADYAQMCRDLREHSAQHDVPSDQHVSRMNDLIAHANRNDISLDAVQAAFIAQQ